MASTSLLYLGFVSIVFILTWIFRNKGRKWVLLICNIIFLLSFGKPIHIIYALLLILYTFLISRSARKMKKNVFLIVLFPYVLGLLFFKYLNFVNWVMPVGLSFYTFKAISYLSDLRSRKLKTANLLDLTLYMSFFPVFTAGPINRAKPFIEQLNRPLVFDYTAQKNGAVQAAFGLFEKIVFADALSQTVSLIYNDAALKGPYVLLAMILYSFQIYTDFDGYSNIAIGVSRMLGFDLEKNFNTPYLAANIKQFWDRWHISLSTWLKDYIYIPLGGSRRGTARRCINVLIVFLVSGAWHGNTLVFILWGLGHGLLTMIEGFMPLRKESRGISRILGIIVNFALVSVLWVFFRSASLDEAFSIFARLFSWGGFSFETLHMTVREGIWLLTVLAIIIITDILRSRTDMVLWLSRQNFILRWAVYILAIVILLIFGAYGSGYDAADFIYTTF